MRHLILSVMLGLWLTACGPFGGGESNAAGESAQTDTVIVVSSTGSHRFAVEIADDPAEQRRGLMYRRELAPDAGMLFLYPEEEMLSYWMRNTYVSLDIIYIDHTGHIVSIARNTTPLSERSIPSAAPANGVLEVVAGTAERLNFQVGDEVHHAYFGN